MSNRQIDTYLAEWEQWQSPLSQRPDVVEELPDGLTNRSFVISDDQTRLVLRLNHPASGQLGIDRKREMLIHRLAMTTGFAPCIYFADENVMVREFVDGRLLDQSDLRRPDILSALCEIQRVVHRLELPDAYERFSYANHLDGYFQRLMSAGIPAGESERIRKEIDELAPTLDAGDWQAVICHHDLSVENIIETDDGLMIIDWEYAAFGHPQMDEIRLLGQGCGTQSGPDTNTIKSLIALMDELWGKVRDTTRPERQELNQGCCL